MEPTTWSARAWRRRRSVRRSRPKPSTSVPAAPGQGRLPLRWLEPAATRSGSQPGTFRPMDPIRSETIRHAATDERGETTLHAREYATLDRAGRVQLPREMTRRLGMRNRVELQEEP